MKNKPTIQEEYINYRKQIKIENRIEYLGKLYKRNQENIGKCNDNLIKIVADPVWLMIAYQKLKRNQGAMTKGFTNEDADEMIWTRIEKISNQIKNGKFEWKPIRKVEIPKPGSKKIRPLAIPNFDERLVQENIRLVLETIYEPSFQTIEVNFGFRPQRTTETAMWKIRKESQGMTTALEGDIKGAYDNVDHEILMDTLKKKVNDTKLLNLIQKGLKTGIFFKEKITHSITGVPQGGIASPILFNIYMHQIDIKITNFIKKKVEEINLKEKRTENPKIKKHQQAKSKNDYWNKKRKENIEKNRSTDTKIIYKDFEKAKKINKIIKDAKIEMRNTKSISQAKKILMFSYTRYADDWIILTNAKKEEVNEWKNQIAKLLKEEAKLELSIEKTIVTDLNKEYAKFLGFTIYKTPEKNRKITTFRRKDGIEVKRSLNVGVRLGIDFERIEKRLILSKIINEKRFPIHNVILQKLKEWQIIQKYKQKVTGIFNYYFHSITEKGILSRLYYYYKFSCLKTLAAREKKSIRKIIIKLGPKLISKYQIESIDKTGQKKIQEREINFPTYRELMEWSMEISKKKTEERIIDIKNKNKKEQNDESGKEKVEQIKKYSNQVEDPSITPFTNIRSGFQLKRNCCICKSLHTMTNPI